jgi:glycosyltransferase involved in cell wall biosynthesis
MNDGSSKPITVAEPLRVLMLSQYPYAESDHALGGIMQTTYQLVAGFIDRDDPALDLRVLSLNESCGAPITCRHGRVTVLHIPKGASALAFVFSEPLRTLYHFLHQLVVFRPHVLHAQGNAGFIMLSLLYGRRSVQTVHGVFRNEQKTIPKSQRTFSTSLRFFLREALESWYLRAIRTIVVTSNQLVTLAKEAGGPPKNIVWVNNSVDTSFFSDPVASPGNGAPVLLFVGLITPRKGLHFLLPAFRQMAAVRSDVSLRIVGITSAAPDYVRQLMQEYAPLIEQRRIVFTGAIGQKALIDEYRRADVFVLPSLGETAPVAISQAMAIGLPVIATQVGGIPDMVADGETGFVVPPGDAGALQSAITKLIADGNLMKTMGAAARRLALDRYHPSANAERMLRVYRDVAAR